MIRPVVLRSYGVTGLRAEGPLGGRIPWFRRHQPVEVTLSAERLEIDLRLSVALGTPVAEVARQVDSAVRFAIAQTLDRDIDRLTIHIGELRVEPVAEPPQPGVAAHRAEAADPVDEGTSPAKGADEGEPG